MKNILSLITGIFLIGIIFNFCLADTGHEGAQRIEQGSYVETKLVTLSSTSTSELLPTNIFRPAASCFNRSNFVIYVGTAAAGVTLGTIGFPVVSSGTISVYGYTGALSGILEAGQTSAAVHCIEYLVQFVLP